MYEHNFTFFLLCTITTHSTEAIAATTQLKKKTSFSCSYSVHTDSMLYSVECFFFLLSFLCENNANNDVLHFKPKPIYFSLKSILLTPQTNTYFNDFVDDENRNSILELFQKKPTNFYF